ncbi:MAG: undecaprenyldiphospho-muramoylpentapeptide beta-N-acetylglucosaminyltransferase [Calditrichaeota bacterium]|nr:undecaprenyldiphospho-muramoylpentapeptide beta-N-acetylglucosaminyltransferase [Calditrichota bacterium]
MTTNAPKRSAFRVLIAGGGTGGHLFPAIAIREALASLATERAVEVLFVGTKHGLEAQLLRHTGERLKFLWISGFAGKNPLRKLRVAVQLVVSMIQSALLLASFRPHVVVGTGGFASGPIVFCAQLLGFPTLLQEQNAFPGLTTRLLARYAKRICVHFPETSSKLPHPERVIVTGNPLRSSLTSVNRRQARQFWGFDEERPVFLVVGGSLGARSINKAIGEALEQILSRANIIWQVGRTGVPQNVDRAFCDRATSSHQLVIRDFIHEMPMAYAFANLALCRAGAITLAELSLVGLPAILVPYPFATHQHQDWNAKAYEKAGAALRIADSELTGGKAAEIIIKLLENPKRLQEMSDAMRTFAKPNAAADIAKIIMELGGKT